MATSLLRHRRTLAWSAGLGCALVAAWGPTATVGGGTTTRVVVEDDSASARHGEGDARARRRLEGLARGDRVGVVSFGESARITSPVLPRDQGASAVPGRSGAHATDVASGLDLAATMIAGLDGDGPVEVLLVSDGSTTSSSAAVEAAALRLRSAGCDRLTFALLPSAAPRACVTQVAGPGRVGRDVPFALEVRGRGSPDAGVVVELLRDGVLDEQRALPPGGAFVVRFERVEDEVASVAFAARVAGSDVPSATIDVVVAQQGGVLVLGSPGVPLAATTRQLPIDAGIEGLLAAHGSVVLWNASEQDVRGITADLRRFVESGGGLVLVGGDRSFGAGRWTGRPIEALSPLTTRPPESEGLLLYVALDGSASMARPWSDAAATTVDAVVREAATAMVRAAAADTTLVLRRFTSSLVPGPTEPAPLTLSGDGSDRALAAIRALAAPAGGTALLPPLGEAFRVMTRRGAGPRHALILTDGRFADDVGTVRAALTRLRDAGVGVTLAVPGGGDAGPALTEATRGTGATVARVGAPGALEAVFRDAEGAARSESAVLRDAVVSPAPGARDLEVTDLPRADRIHRLWLAPEATPLLVAGAGEPVAALGMRGRGRVVALATDPGGWWRGAREVVPALLGLVSPPQGGRVRVERDDANGLLVLWEGGPRGRPVSVAWHDGVGRESLAALREVDGGLLRARLPQDAAPTVVHLLAADGAEVAAVGLDVPAPPEYRSAGPLDLPRIVELASGGTPRRVVGLAPWLAGAAVLLLLIGAARR